MKAKILGLLTAGLLMSSMGANAAIVSGTYYFEAHGGWCPPNAGPPTFTCLGVAPTDPVTGLFTISFDDSVNTTNSILNITLNSINIATGAVGYTYTFADDRLHVGGTLAGVTTVNTGTNDWFLRIVLSSANPMAPTFSGFRYAAASDVTRQWFSETGTVRYVPLPAAAWLLLSGLAGVGVLRRRKTT